MLLVIESILSLDEAAAARTAAQSLEFGDGKATAGRFVRTIKSNDQALASPGLEALQSKVSAALAANPVFQAAARPKSMTRLILSRYQVGQAYGLHVDDALMGGLRTDLSFTLFLEEPDSYDGGALIIDDGMESRAIKLSPGDLILYPSTTLHRVEAVTRGTRLAMVGWVQSWIRSTEQREILFDLDRSVEEVFAREGKSPLFDQLAKSRSNLIRMWADS